MIETEINESPPELIPINHEMKNTPCSQPVRYRLSTGTGGAMKHGIWSGPVPYSSPLKEPVS